MTVVAERLSINDRFQLLAEHVSKLAGNWKHVCFWLVLILCWAGAGPAMRFSDSWQLLVNTPTTVFELFLELTILAGQSRQDRRIEEIIGRIDARTATILTEEQTIEHDLITELAALSPDARQTVMHAAAAVAAVDAVLPTKEMPA